MKAEFAYDVFLSHNKADKPRVRRLAERLRAANLRVWFDDWVIEPGDDIYLAIERGLEASRTLVLCLSPAALGSDWVTLERSTVLFRDPSSARRRFIPLLLADCELPDALRRYKYVDYREETQAAFDQVLAGCRPQRQAEKVPVASKPHRRRSGAPFSDEEAAEVCRLGRSVKMWSRATFYRRFCEALKEDNPTETCSPEHFRTLIRPGSGRRGLMNYHWLAFARTFEMSIEEFQDHLRRRTASGSSVGPPAPSSDTGQHLEVQPGTFADRVHERAVVLTRMQNMPQGADVVEFPISGGRLERVACLVETSNPYFRFGLKLFRNDGKLFGDGCIQSRECIELVVHVGRNNWSRSEIGIMSGDLFFACYVNGVRPGSHGHDQKMCRPRPRLRLPVELSVDGGFVVRFVVDGKCWYQGVQPQEACRRLAMYAWADQDGLSVRISDIDFRTVR